MATFPRINDDDYYHGNIFHIAAKAESEEFIREAIGKLPQEATQQLLVQPRPPRDFNPLHVAAGTGNVEIVKMFINVFTCLPSDHHQSQPQPQPPWLRKSSRGDNIFHIAASGKGEDLIREAIQMLPVEHTQLLLLQLSDDENWNPLHLAAVTGNEEIVKMFLDAFRSAPLPPDPSKRPWLLRNSQNRSPCHVAVFEGHEDCALEILKIDKETLSNELTGRDSHLLYEAICYKMTKLALEILTSCHSIGWAGNKGRTPFHAMDRLEESDDAKDIFRLIVGKKPELIEQKDKNGDSAFHFWALAGKAWPFRILLESKNDIQYVMKVFVGLISDRDSNGDNPLHTLAKYVPNEKASIEISKLLVDTYKHDEASSISDDDHPWLVPNGDGDTALSLAVGRKFEELALYLLSVDENTITKGHRNVLFLAVENGCHEVAEKIMDIIENKQWSQPHHINKLLDYYSPGCSTLFLAIKCDCTKVAKEMLARLDKKSWTRYLEDSSNGKNILHVAPKLKDEKFGAWLVREASEYIAKEDKKKQTPLDEASRIGATWFIKAALRKDPSVLETVPSAWVHASENGHISAVRAFVEPNAGKFRDQCIKRKDSPLHHIKLQSLTEYEALFKIPRMKDLINLQNSDGDTPLHIALRNRDISLAEILLSMDNINYDVKSKKDELTAIDILDQVCREKEEWELMCYRNKLDPYIKTTYYQLWDARNSLLVVAALLATITFTAGFTLPGGLNQESGVALLTKKPGFLAFLMFDALGMCSSMLVLIGLVWSMLHSSKKAVVYIDWSMKIIMVAFYSTLLAFMTGVYIVTSQDVLGVAITVIIMCSVIGISAYKGFFYRFLSNFFQKKKNYRVDGSKQV